MMRALVVILLALNLAACGHRGNLKNPSQIEAEEAKKARDAARTE